MTALDLTARSSYMQAEDSMTMSSSTEEEDRGVGGMISKIVRVLTVLGAVFIILFVIQAILAQLGYTTTGSAGFLLGVSAAMLFLPLVGYLFELVRDAWGGLGD